MSDHPHNFPKLHNASWPGVVGKDPDSDQPPIDLDTMLDLTAAAEVDGIKFDGTDLFLFDPHVSIDSTRGRSDPRHSATTYQVRLPTNLQPVVRQRRNPRLCEFALHRWGGDDDSDVLSC